ncbi:MAG TPA: hypothetical protein VGY66_01655, partial [Gemmataceae bacterium]|nr:hypothetical protein [Gemmataceae bacterium]
EAAIAEVEACGYENLRDELDVLGYLEQYRPTWKQSAEPPAAAPTRGKPRPRKRPRGLYDKRKPGNTRKKTDEGKGLLG